MSTGVVALSADSALFFGASVATLWFEKPELCSVPFRALLSGTIAVPFPKPPLTTVPRAPFAPPVPFPYPGPPGRAGEPSTFILTARFGLLLFAGNPCSSPNPPVCTFSIGAFTVAGAALPMLAMLFSFTSSRGRFGPACVVSIFTTSNCGFSSGAFASSVLGCGMAAFGVMKMCGCLGFNFTGSGTTGGGVLALIFGGGGGGGCVGTIVTGCASSMIE